MVSGTGEPELLVEVVRVITEELEGLVEELDEAVNSEVQGDLVGVKVVQVVLPVVVVGGFVEVVFCVVKTSSHSHSQQKLWNLGFDVETPRKVLHNDWNSANLFSCWIPEDLLIKWLSGITTSLLDKFSLKYDGQSFTGERDLEVASQDHEKSFLKTVFHADISVVVSTLKEMSRVKPEGKQHLPLTFSGFT